MGVVEWAFAGSSSSETRHGDDDDGVPRRHSVWRHFVDSRAREDPENAVVDEADMFPQEEEEEEGDGDGGGSRALERGRMVNPDTGRETDYEEMWRDVEPRSVPVPVLRKPDDDGDGDDGDAKVRCVVLELRDDAAERRGLVVCVGRHCQGVARGGEAFALEQWEWREHGREQTQAQGRGEEGGGRGRGRSGGVGGWRRRRRVGAGHLYLPCIDAVENVGLEIGARVERDGVVWTVVEASEA